MGQLLDSPSQLIDQAWSHASRRRFARTKGIVQFQGPQGMGTTSAVLRDMGGSIVGDRAWLSQSVIQQSLWLIVTLAEQSGEEPPPPPKVVVNHMENFHCCLQHKGRCLDSWEFASATL